ncbi:MAG: hypothetical protein GKS03_02030 [Alphaproteobacteria bacterium]|nr:hypothetical protein [Alphaproteobacteria bacterium]
MTAVGSDNGGNPQTIALTHTIRVLIVAFVIPFLMVMLAGYERPTAGGRTMIDVSGSDLGVLAACCLVGLWAGMKFKFPAGALAGPLALSAIFHITGLTASSPPDILVSIAQVVLGASVGARFAGLTLAKTGKTIGLAVVATIGMLILSGAGAMLIGPLINVEPLALLLALAPGGVTEMSLMALALDQDIAFVTTHHVVRIALIVMIGPAVFAALERLRARSTPTTETRE